MTSTVRHVGFANPAIAFPLLERRSLAVNTANRQLAVGEELTGATTGAALPLIAIRYFAESAQYVADDFVIAAGQIYKAVTTVEPGAFDPSQWVGMTDGGQFLLLDGTRNMHGNLQIDKPGASLVLNAIGSSQADIWFRRDGLTRWLLRSDETPAVDFFIARFDDVGFVIDTPLKISRANGGVSVLRDPTLPLELAPKQYVDSQLTAVLPPAGSFVLRAGDTMTGGLIAPVLTINNAAYSDLYWSNGGHARWLARGADATTSNYELHRYDAAGNYLGAALVIENANGIATFQNVIKMPGLQFGGDAPSGFYGDGGNVAIRTYGSGGIYFQSQSGAANYGWITGGGLHVEGTVDARYLLATSGDGLQNYVPAGSYARTRYRVTGTREWSTGLYPDGRFIITDESIGAWRVIINLDGTIQFNGQLEVFGPVRATEFLGPGGTPIGGAGGGVVPTLEGVYYIDFQHPGDTWDYSARIITTGNSPSPGGLSPLTISSGEVTFTEALYWKGFHGHQGMSGPFEGQIFNFWARLPPEAGAFRLWVQDIDVASIQFNFGLRSSEVRDVVPLPPMWDAVKRLNPVRLKRPHLFAHTETLAFVAEEVRAAIGERSVVEYGTDGEPETVEPLAMIAVLTKALQEAMARIEALEAA